MSGPTNAATWFYSELKGAGCVARRPPRCSRNVFNPCSCVFLRAAMSEAIGNQAGGLRAFGNACFCRRYAISFYSLLLTRVGRWRGRVDEHNLIRIKDVDVKATIHTEPPDFSLVLGGPLYQLYLRTRLARAPIELLHRRIIAFVLITWVPLWLLTAIEGPWRRCRSTKVLSCDWQL